MNRNKRVVSCPNFLPRSNRRLDSELNNASILKKIESQYVRCVPRVLGHPVKLTDLFTAVVNRGGYRTVCDQRLWADVARELGLPSACTNCSIGLRRIYYQFLSKHEISEYPNLSENFLAQNFVDFGGTETVFSELSHMPATSVERNLGFDQSLPNAGLSHSSFHSLSELTDASNRLSRTHPHNQDTSWPFGEKVSTERSEADGAIRGVPGGYTNLDDPARLRDLSELRLAELALESGLPNEIDFALNSLLALSVTPSITGASTSIRLAQCNNLLSLILATVGIYDDGANSFVMCDPVWRKQTQLNFLKFWHNMVRDSRGRLFLRPDVFINADPDNDEDEVSTFVELFAPSDISTAELIGSRLIQSSHVSDVHEDTETARALLVATILVNLVTPSPTQSATAGRFEDEDDDSDYDAVVTRTLSPYSSSSPGLAAWRENARYLAGCPTGLRFAFLAAHAHHSGLRQLGLQLISSLRYPLDPPPSPISSLECPHEWTPLVDRGCRLGELTLTFLARSILECDDRASLIAGLTFLSNLAKVPEKANEVSLLNGLPAAVWPRLAQLICLPDLAVVCAGLEALRCLTNLGHFACVFGWQACLASDLLECNGLPLTLLQPLLSLLTLEGQAMGSQSLHRIKLMQRHPQPIPINSHAHPRPAAPHISRTHHVHPEWSSQAQFHRIAPALPPPGPPQLPRCTPPQLPIQLRNERVPSIAGPYVPSSFNTLSHPIRPSRPPASIGADIMAATNRPTVPIYRPPGGSTSCTGLINLLASSTSPPPCSLPVPGSASPSSAMATVTATPLVTTATTVNTAAPTVANTVLSADSGSKPTTPSPSLSELTDRLQMPPPSLPPPSALRRSAKSGQSRSSITGSPVTTPRSKSASVASPTAVSSPVSSITGSTAAESASAMDDSMESQDAPDSVTLSNSPPSKPSPLNASPNRVKREDSVDALSPADQSAISIGSKCSESLCVSNVNGVSNHNTTCVTSSPIVTPTKQPKAEDGPLKPLVNGELKANLNGDPELDLAPRSKTVHQRNFTCGSPINGLKPGILQAAMNVLENQKLDDLGCSANSQKLDDSQTVVVNGAMESSPANNVLSKSKADKLVEHAVAPRGSLENPPSQNQSELNGIGVSTPDSSVNDTHDPCNTDRHRNTCPVINNETMNGELESNSSSSGSSSEAETSPEARKRTSKPNRYLLKRRRRWGSRSRLFTLKRRREHTQIDRAPQFSNSESPEKLKLTTSPLKPLPLQSDPLPDSVLGPGWRPMWSTSADLSATTEFLPKTTPSTSVQNSTSTGSVDSVASQSESTTIHPYRSESSQEETQSSNSTTSEAAPASPTYTCEWESCMASFVDKSQVSSHVYLSHLVTKQSESTPPSPNAYIHPALPVRRCCRWRGCPSASLARAPFALLTHVLDVHCSSAELDAQYRFRSKTASSESRPAPNPTNLSTSTASSSSLSDLQNLCSTVPMDVSSSPSGDPSAWTIVRSLEAKQMQLDLWAAQHHFVSANPHSRLPLPILGPNPHHPQPPILAPPPREGPVTKHLRVSAALVIRNLVTYVEEARTWLLSELPLLSEVVMGCSPSDGGLRTNDASRIIAQCLSICTRNQKLTDPIGPFLPGKPLPSEYFPRGLLLPPIPRGPSTHARHKRHHASSSSVPRPPVFNVDLDARTT